jgi:RNA polymerase sigma-70 factor (ECF subfamily)
VHALTDQRVAGNPPDDPADNSTQGDDTDFRRQLLLLVPYLRAFAQTLSRNPDTADDLAQEALANAWNARSTFQAGTNLKAWLFVILRNIFYSAHRRKWRQADWDEGAMERLLVTPATQEASMDLVDLRRALTLLPDEQREALILVGASGFSYIEAATICACATGTMKSRVSRARQTLARLLDAPDQLPPRASIPPDEADSLAAELVTRLPYAGHAGTKPRRPLSGT